MMDITVLSIFDIEIQLPIIALKYLYKFVYKGLDMIMVRLQQRHVNNNGTVPPRRHDVFC